MIVSTQKQRDLWNEYKYNRGEYLKQDIMQLQQNIRYRDIDIVDCIELALAIERLNTFNQVCKSVEVFLKLGE